MTPIIPRSLISLTIDVQFIVLVGFNVGEGLKIVHPFLEWMEFKLVADLSKSLNEPDLGYINKQWSQLWIYQPSIIISHMESEKQDKTSLTRIPHWRLLDCRTTTVIGNVHHPGNTKINIGTFHRNNEIYGEYYMLVFAMYSSYIPWNI